ncbi:phasin family protein [Massilia antarctica]|uniref:phasin family protein n=1 Tax=Massilia antarctica TaxID=2765360 RepID=UPI0006BB5628|nr:phasin family protein [Massilia sp. H27-R4]MCY0915602.1 phasin family protein [Massilia sp. H27-R4]CUI04045.1 Polyhydroxyalkanoate granule-associated protein PhaF [Janthinobacterium sp. CG23_2]CUU27831.1 Polyhydroxyalkanoate granule-associated protein PhaF [Janthinobacterium sp. CG23_2]
MEKKLKPQTIDEDAQLTDTVRSSAHQVWQAGLGAFAKAQQEGSRVFNKLLEEGNELQKRTRSMAGDKADNVADAAADVADLVARQAAGSWDKMEQVFEDRVTRALATMGVPTRQEVDALALKVEQLSKQLDELRATSPKAAPKAAPRKAAAKAAKPAVKTAAARARKPALKKAAAPKGGKGE